MLQLQADTRVFNQAMSDLIRTLGKDMATETKRQAKLLCLAIAAAAPPRPRGAKNGLAGNIPKLRSEAWMKVVKRLVKPAYGMRVLDAARMNDPGILWGIATTTKRTNLFHSSTMNRLLKLAVEGGKDTGPNPTKALEIFRQIFRGKLGGPVPVVHQSWDANAANQYYRLVDKMAKVGLPQISEAERVFLVNRIQTERRNIIKAYRPTIGTMKAGWVQAGVAIPVKAGKKPPNWLLNKKTIGGSTTTGTEYSLVCTIRNSKGNALGVNERLNYVGKAIRYRTRKMVNGLKGAINASLAKKYRRAGQPVPAHLKSFAKADDAIDTPL